ETSVLLARRCSCRWYLRTWSSVRNRSRRRRDGLRSGGCVNIPPEDHLARSRLQYARDDNIDRLANGLSRVVDDDHRPVVQVRDALVVFLAFLQDKDLHQLAG